MIKYWQPKVKQRVSVEAKIRFKTNCDPKFEEIIREDCARASLSYHFIAMGEDGQVLKGPEVILVARVKPKKHHFKVFHLKFIMISRLEISTIAFLMNN